MVGEQVTLARCHHPSWLVRAGSLCPMLADNGVTLVVASYNHSKYVEECLESYAAQDADELTLIVTDDASSDDSQRVIRETIARLGLNARTVFNSHNQGICATFNAALQQVRTPFVAFLAADDWMHPQRISRQRAALQQAGDDVGFLYGDILWSGSGPGREPEPYSPCYPAEWGFGTSGPDLFAQILDHNFIPAPSVMMSTGCARAVGGYDETLVYEDHDMWLRLSRRFKVAFLRDPLVYWRVTPSSLGSALNAGRKREYHLANLRILEKHADVVSASALVEAKLYDNARMAYALGANTREVRRHLISGSRARGPKGAAVALAAQLRISPALLFDRRGDSSLGTAGTR